MAHLIQDLMETSMKNIKEMVDVNVIVGDPIQTPDGTTIVPVSKVSYGFGAGGSDIPVKNVTGTTQPPFGGGAGAGISIKPVVFLVVGNNQIKMLPVEAGALTPIDKIFEFIPQMVDKLNSIINENKKNKKEAEESDEF